MSYNTLANRLQYAIIAVFKTGGFKQDLASVICGQITIAQFEQKYLYSKQVYFELFSVPAFLS